MGFARTSHIKRWRSNCKEWIAPIDLLEADVENVGADMKVQRAEELRE
jgi:hypothetical protein